MKWTWILLVAGLLPACSPPPTGPGPGSTPAGQTCTTGADCGCWTCDCQGIDGAGAAQLCLGGHCPSGEEACAADCASANAKVASATAANACPGRQSPP